MSVKLIRITTVPGSLFTLLKGQMGFMSKNGFDVIAVANEEELTKEVEKREGVRSVGIPMTRKITPLKDLSSLWKLYRFFKKEKPSIVHTHTPKAGILGMLAAKLSGVPLRLHTVAGLPLLVAEGGKRKLLNSVEKITYACATKVYPNSMGLKEIILENKFTKPSKLEVIGNGSSNGIDTEFFNPELVEEETKRALRKQLNINENDFVFLFVGRIVKDKGIQELTKAFTNLCKMHRHIHLIVAGRFEQELDPIDAETEQVLQNHQQIHLVGFQENIIDYFAVSDALTFPSYREGFPNVVMQAAAMQLPCIVTNINGCNEIIQDGLNGWIIPVGVVDEQEEKMKWMLEHAEESKQMGMKSRTYMQQNFERKFVWQKILDEYQKLLKS